MEAHIQVEKVFHLSCPDRAQLVARLKKRALRDNRLDDANESVIRHRLETYEAETKPVLDHYGPAMVQEIDATQTPARVLWEILGGVLSTPATTPPVAIPASATPPGREPMLAGVMHP